MTARHASDCRCWLCIDREKRPALSASQTPQAAPPVAGEDQPTQAEWEEMAYRFCCLLEHVTGGLMSQPNYDLAVMKAVADDHINDMIEQALAEAAAPTPQVSAVEKDAARLQWLIDKDMLFAWPDERENWSSLRAIGTVTVPGKTNDVRQAIDAAIASSSGEKQA